MANHTDKPGPYSGTVLRNEQTETPAVRDLGRVRDLLQRAVLERIGELLQAISPSDLLDQAGGVH
jgi:hypothetical protein